MKTIIIVQGKNLKDISSINRRIITLLGSLRTSATNFMGCCTFSGLLSEEEKEELTNEFGEDYILSFIETDNKIESDKEYISSKM